MNIERMTTTIGLFEGLQASRHTIMRTQVRELLTAFPRLVRERKPRFFPNFNLLQLCGLGPDEVQHSFILAWLLDEDAGHAHGSLFFKAFASIIGLELDGEAEGYSVYPEFAGFESITDIVIYKPRNFYVSIENKINAGEGSDQLNREYRDREAYADSLNIPTDRRIAVFLTPDGRQPITGNPKKWVQLSYLQIASAFNSVPYKETSQKLRFFVEDWIASIKNYTP